jgi:hypothetical protein
VTWFLKEKWRTEAGRSDRVTSTKVTQKSTALSQNSSNFVFEKHWKNSEEFRDCRSIKGRFQQYFVHGDSLDCASWEHDFEDCLKYEDKNDLKAAKRVIDNETLRRKERLKNHYSNNVWKKRDAPPEDWAKPLPEHLTKGYENSFLDLKSKELKGELHYLFLCCLLMSFFISRPPHFIRSCCELIDAIHLFLYDYVNWLNPPIYSSTVFDLDVLIYRIKVPLEKRNCAIDGLVFCNLEAREDTF